MTKNVIIDGSTQVLAPGDYSQVTVKNGGIAIMTEGCKIENLVLDADTGATIYLTSLEPMNILSGRE